MHPQRTGPNTPEGKAQRPLAAALEEAGTPRTCRGEQVRFARSGKARSSANAIKHGLTSRHVVLPGENRAEFDALVAQLIEENQAGNTLEIEIIHEIAGCMWRLDRARRAESEYFYVNFIADKATKETERRFALILRYAGAIERELHRSITRLQQLQKAHQPAAKREIVSSKSVELTTDHRPLITKLTTDNRQLTTEFVSPTSAPLGTSHQPLATSATQLTTDHRPLTTKLTTDNRQLITI